MTDIDHKSLLHDGHVSKKTALLERRQQHPSDEDTEKREIGGRYLHFLVDPTYATLKDL
jgi:hypothetical protein